MISKKNIVDQVLASGKLTLDEAVKRAMAVKEIKNKDAIRAWKNMFAQNGVITRDATGTYVSPKVAEAPIIATVTPVTTSAEVAVVPTAAVVKAEPAPLVEVPKKE